MEDIEFAEELKTIIQPMLDEDDIELFEIITVKTRNNFLLRLLVDRREGGISLGECAGLNRKIRAVLDTGNIIPQDYSLEVSSPGADRPLKTRKDFLRSISRDVKFFLKEPINGKIETNGFIKEVSEEAVIIDTGKIVLSIPLQNIVKAKQIID